MEPVLIFGLVVVFAAALGYGVGKGVIEWPVAIVLSVLFLLVAAEKLAQVPSEGSPLSPPEPKRNAVGFQPSGQ